MSGVSEWGSTSGVWGHITSLLWFLHHWSPPDKLRSSSKLFACFNSHTPNKRFDWPATDVRVAIGSEPSVSLGFAYLWMWRLDPTDYIRNLHGSKKRKAVSAMPCGWEGLLGHPRPRHLVHLQRSRPGLATGHRWCWTREWGRQISTPHFKPSLCDKSLIILHSFSQSPSSSVGTGMRAEATCVGILAVVAAKLHTGDSGQRLFTTGMEQPILGSHCSPSNKSSRQVKLGMMKIVSKN